MTRALHVSDALSFPALAVTETFGILAVRGAGKSNTAAVMAEEMFKAKLPFVVVDPVRAWWGLRAARDGSGPGLPIPIFGGRRGDVPLERGAGNLMADLVVDQRLSCVLDLSDFDSEAGKKQFLLDFAKRLYQRNEQPLHLFLEEADDYIPQRPMRDEAQLLRAWENIVRRGRNRGLGITLITQRSASVNKSVLTQVQTLIAMRTTGPQDIAAIKEWVRYHQQSEQILASLAQLADGEAWVWSPQLLGKTVRVRFRRRETFDSGATPKMGEGSRAPATLADIDLAAVKARMAATIEKAKAEDPRELRREIASLKAQLAQRPVGNIQRPVRNIEPKRVEVPMLKDAQVKRLEYLAGRLEAIGKTFEGWRAALDDRAQGVREAAAEISEAVRKAGLHDLPSGVKPRPPAPIYHRRGTMDDHRPVPKATPIKGGPQEKILAALAWWQSAGVGTPTRHQVAFVAGYTVNGHFNNTLGSMRTDGLIEYPGGSLVALTPAGATQAGPPPARPSLAELVERVRAVLRDEPRRRVFDVLTTAPAPLSREDLARAAGYTVNGHFNNVLGSLSSLGVAVYPRKGYVALGPAFDGLD